MPDIYDVKLIWHLTRSIVNAKGFGCYGVEFRLEFFSCNKVKLLLNLLLTKGKEERKVEIDGVDVKAGLQQNI